MIFFASLSNDFNDGWYDNADLILENQSISSHNFQGWKVLYHKALSYFKREDLTQIISMLERFNPNNIPVRPLIEQIWQPINDEDNWQLFYDFLAKIK